MPIFSTGIGIFRRELNLFRVSTVGLPSQVIGFCLPQIYRKSTKKHGFLWFLKAAVIRCFSIFDTQKARKIGYKREQKTTKEIKTLHRFKNLKSLGSDTVPVQVRSAAPSLCDEKEYMQKKSDYSDFFVAQTPKFFRVKPWMFFEKKRYGTGFKLTLLRI